MWTIEHPLPLGVTPFGCDPQEFLHLASRGACDTGEACPRERVEGLRIEAVSDVRVRGEESEDFLTILDNL